MSCERWRSCYFYCTTTNTCDYALRAGTLRGMPVSDCTKYKPKIWQRKYTGLALPGSYIFRKDEFMAPNLEHPAITNALRTGYGYDHTQEICPDCNNDIGDYTFEIDPDHFVCKECFKDWLLDYLSTNPEEVADAMSVPCKYRG